MKFIDFIQLSEAEQNKRFKEAGFLDYNTFPLERDKFVNALNLSLETDEIYSISLNIDSCHPVYSLKSNRINVWQYMPDDRYIRMSYYLDDNGDWRITIADRLFTFDDEKEYRDIDNGHSRELFDIKLTGLTCVYESFISSGKTMLDFQLYCNNIESELIAVAKELASIYKEYPKIYRSYAKVPYFRTYPFEDENPGYMGINQLVCATYILRKLIPEIKPLHILVIYYALTMGETGISQDKANDMLKAISVEAIADNSLIDIFKKEDFDEVYNNYMATLPEFPYYNYITKINDEYYEMKKKARENLMKIYNVSENVFNEHYSPEYPCNEFSAFEM